MHRIILATFAISFLATTGCNSSSSRARYAHGSRYSDDANLADIANRPAPVPMDNGDVIRMKQAGLSNELVLNSIKDRGGEFDLSADGVIHLSQNKVPDELITAIQDMGKEQPKVVPASATTRYVDPPPRRSVVVVARPFTPLHHHHPRPRMSRRRSRASISFGHGFCFD